jgi:cyclic beta-1,2-glucan synthetase
MNRVGSDGKGESIWLAWFLIDTLESLLKVCEARIGRTQEQAYRRAIGELTEAVELHGWDGEWYRRAYFDDGTPLGSRANDEARIDSLPQSWAVLSEAARPERAISALRAAERQLVLDADKLIPLDPPSIIPISILVTSWVTRPGSVKMVDSIPTRRCGLPRLCPLETGNAGRATARNDQPR